VLFHEMSWLKSTVFMLRLLHEEAAAQGHEANFANVDRWETPCILDKSAQGDSPKGMKCHRTDQEFVLRCTTSTPPSAVRY